MFILQQWLIEQRQAKNLTLEQLANLLAKPISYVQNVENGKHSLDIVKRNPMKCLKTRLKSKSKWGGTHVKICI
ncbi:helix-turn-helix domain-containing protein [Acinetobacter baumannii]|uniref:helix-turn-helix domain-containing protein n=1 Tax=Acinetobacter baumannii TaxID=470 RepID=UPI00207BE21D|nr:helix-turn-helix transcriptional regulator [Acinetobacter baumannii]MDC4592272.1 helix-turn-helix domain-containing protein [Acinetobacter baumannii]MDC4779852.1 helix-turn-helix domain-containing protein [Acinetobacter baumannii]